MKKTAVLLLVILLCASAFARVSKSRAVSKPKVPESYDIAVCVTGGLNESEKAVLGSWVFHALVRSGRFTAAERASAFTEEIGAAQVTRGDGVVDDGYIGRAAKQFGIRYVCIVGVVSYSGYYTVSSRILDTKTAKITASGRVYGELNSTQALETLALDVVTEMGVGWYQFAPLNRSIVPLVASEPPPPPAAATPTPSPAPPPAAATPTPPPAPQPVAATPTPPSAPPPAAATPTPPPAPPPVAATPTPPPAPPPAAVTPTPPPAPQPVAATPTPPPPPPAAVDTTPPLSLEAVGASIIIHSRPPEAQVYIGERLIGKTNQPDKLLVPIGTHDVKFVKDDLEKTEAMTFQPGENPTKLVLLDEGKPKKKSKPKAK